MTNMSRRPFSGAADLQAMSALANQFSDDNLHVADLPYRFSSWAMDEPDNVGLWVDEKGALVGWVVMQTPFWTIDYVCHPEAEPTLHSQILAWVDERAQQIVDTASGRPVWFINVFTTQQARMGQLEAAGFASQADVGENSWTKVLMKRPGEKPVDDYALPAGFTIRPLAGEAETAAYVDLHRATFESNSMTNEWRQRTLQHPAYMAGLDLVAVALDGQLVAFCICWLNQAPQPSGQVEPLGVHKEFRQMGLGKSILLEGLRRLRERGAQSMYVETDNYRDEAFALYESVDFRVQHEVLVYRKDYAEF